MKCRKRRKKTISNHKRYFSLSGRVKYKITDICKIYKGIRVCRIEALENFGNIRKGQIGGWIQNKSNLSQEGLCWVADEAIVYHCSKVIDDAIVEDYAKVYGNAIIKDNALVRGRAEIYHGGSVIDDAEVGGNNRIGGFTKIGGSIIME